MLLKLNLPFDLDLSAGNCYAQACRLRDYTASILTVQRNDQTRINRCYFNYMRSADDTGLMTVSSQKPKEQLESSRSNQEE